MANIKLTGHTWDTSGIYDAEQEKTQKQVNADVAELKNTFNAVTGFNPIEIANIEQYGINASGKNTSSSYTKYYRTGGFYQPIHIKATSTRGSLKTTIYFYSSADTDTFISASSTYDNLDSDITYPTGAKYVRVSGYVNGNPDDPLDLTAVTVEMTLPENIAPSRITQLESDVDVLETNVAKSEAETEQTSKNLVDQDFILSFNGWQKTGNAESAVYSGLSNNIKATTLLDDFEENTVYTASFEAYTDQETVSTGNGFRIYFDYTDSSALSEYALNSATTWTLITLTSNPAKSISTFKLARATGSDGNTWHIRNFQITKSNRVETFVPHTSARDTVAEDKIAEAKSDIFRRNFWDNGRIKLAMHQGMRSAEQPVGNCELSFRTAGINKAWAIETDLRKTSDGYYVCFHDADVDTLTDGSGTLSEMTYAQIRALHYVNQSTSAVTDQIIPSFEEYVQICKTYGCVPLIELKIRPTEAECQEIVDILSDYGVTNYMFITSLSDTSAIIRNVTDAPMIELCASLEDYSTLSSYISAASLKNCGIDFDRLTLGESITHALVSDVHNAGMFCGVYTSNTESAIIDWFELGVDFVTSDYIADLTT